MLLHWSTRTILLLLKSGTWSLWPITESQEATYVSSSYAVQAARFLPSLPYSQLRPLPAKHVDTGMGFERLLSILQNKMSNYDTDLFTPIFDAISKITGAPKYEGKFGAEDVNRKDMAYRVVADHIRTLTFSITDGAVRFLSQFFSGKIAYFCLTNQRPGPTGRGFVLRRILRRAVRYGREFLGGKEGFFHQLVPCVVENFGDFFPELKNEKDLAMEIIRLEEEKFSRSVEAGTNMFKSITKNMKPGDTIGANELFLLYNTYGFPEDLTRLMAEEVNLKIDSEGFKAKLDELRTKTRATSKQKLARNALELGTEAVHRLNNEFKVPVTKDQFKYQLEDIQATILAIYDGKEFHDEYKVCL